MSGLRILIAAQENIREVLGAMLREDGCDVLAVASTADAIAQAPQFRPDTLIIELIMPGIDGLRAAKRIAQDTKCRVLLLAERRWPRGFDNYLNQLQQEVPGCDVLPVPFEKAGLLAILHGRAPGWSFIDKSQPEPICERAPHVWWKSPVPSLFRRPWTKSGPDMTIAVLIVLLVWTALAIGYYRWREAAEYSWWWATFLGFFAIVSIGTVAASAEGVTQWLDDESEPGLLRPIMGGDVLVLFAVAWLVWGTFTATRVHYYFTMLRWAVCFSALVTATMCARMHPKLQHVTDVDVSLDIAGYKCLEWLLVAIAVTFNPMLTPHYTPLTWKVLDVLAALVFCSFLLLGRWR